LLLSQFEFLRPALHFAVTAPKLNVTTLAPAFSDPDCSFVVERLELVRLLDMASAVEKVEPILDRSPATPVYYTSARDRSASAFSVLFPYDRCRPSAKLLKGWWS